MKHTAGNRGFTLVENVITTALVALLSLGLIGMIITATKLTRSARESINAIEVAESTLESLRSCSWSQLHDTNFVPRQFVATNGIVYSGTLILRKPLTTEIYKDDVIQASVLVNWGAAKQERSVQLHTFISSYGVSSLP